MKIDRCIQEDNVPIALREDKLEFGPGGSDEGLIHTCKLPTVTISSWKFSLPAARKANNFLAHGVPCLLICLIGTWCCSLILASVDLILPRAHVGRMWWVLCYKPVIEPLGQPVFMLADHTWTRQGEVARLLGALVRGISSLRR